MPVQATQCRISKQTRMLFVHSVIAAVSLLAPGTHAFGGLFKKHQDNKHTVSRYAYHEQSGGSCLQAALTSAEKAKYIAVYPRPVQSLALLEGKCSDAGYTHPGPKEVRVMSDKAKVTLERFCKTTVCRAPTRRPTKRPTGRPTNKPAGIADIMTTLARLGHTTTAAWIRKCGNALGPGLIQPLNAGRKIRRYTLYSPSNAAWAKLKASPQLSLIENDSTLRLKTMKNLLTLGYTRTSILRRRPSISTMAGEKLTVSNTTSHVCTHGVYAECRMINTVTLTSTKPLSTADGFTHATVMAPVDTPCVNGLIHPLDAVILPPGVGTAGH